MRETVKVIMNVWFTGTPQNMIKLAWSPLVWQPFDSVSSTDDIHKWDARDFSYSSTKLAVACGHDVAFIGGNALNEAVVGVCPRMRTW